MIPTRRSNDTGSWNCARQHVGECAAGLERSGVLKEFEFEDNRDRVESEVCAIDFEYRSTTNVRPDNKLSLLDSLAREFGSLGHCEQYSSRVGGPRGNDAECRDELSRRVHRTQFVCHPVSKQQIRLAWCVCRFP